MVSIRGATEADLERLVEVHGACYPDERPSSMGASARRLNFTENPLGALKDLHVAVENKRIVGHGFGFSLSAFFGGVAVPVVGIASVAVAPEARGAGIASAIVDAIEKQSRKRGAVLCILHAFRHGFYARLGYATVATNQRLAVDPRAIPQKWIADARTLGLRSANAKDAKKIAALHELAAKNETGWLARSPATWTRRITREQIHFAIAENGFVAFEMSQREEHDETRMIVRDFVATNDATRRALWGFLAMQSGQIAAIEIETRIDDPIAFALTDIDGNRFGSSRVEHDLGGVVAGPMIRMLDVRAALLARRYEADGEVDLVVDKKPMRVVVRNGNASIKKGISRGAISVDARVLASIAFGGLRVKDAARLDLVRARNSKAIDAADAMFRIPPFFTVDRF